MFCAGGQGGKFEWGLYAQWLVHTMSNEAMERAVRSSPAELEFGEGAGVGCYIRPPSQAAAYYTGRTKEDPLAFSVSGCLSAGRRHNRTENQLNGQHVPTQPG